MAKKNKSSKKKKHIRGIQSITIPSQIIKARNYPIHSCYANSEWKDRGITTVFITRAKPDGLFIAGIYLIDIWCLGVKDAFYQINISEHQLEEIIHKNPNEPLIQVSSDFAHSLIYGAVRYAEKLGFKPHRDFKMAKYILEKRQDIEFDDSIEFGKDGKPFYFTGPYESKQKEKMIIETLRKNVGEGNFDFVVKYENSLI